MTEFNMLHKDTKLVKKNLFPFAHVCPYKNMKNARSYGNVFEDMTSYIIYNI